MHCYEVIPENAVCKLYFDLEFNKRANPEADGKKMVALLIEVNDKTSFLLASFYSSFSFTYSFIEWMKPVSYRFHISPFSCYCLNDFHFYYFYKWTENRNDRIQPSLVAHAALGKLRQGDYCQCETSTEKDCVYDRPVFLNYVLILRL